MTRLATERLILSAPEIADIPELFRFLGDADAMLFTQSCKDLNECIHLVTTHERQREAIGCAPWVVREFATNQIIGWGGLYDDPFDPGWGVELAYKFAPESWGKGYATELVFASLAVARDELSLPSIIAFSHPENAASHKVLQKAGFVEKRFVPDMNRVLFEVLF